MAHGHIIGVTLHRTARSPSDVACVAKSIVEFINDETVGEVRDEFRYFQQFQLAEEELLVEKASLKEDVCDHMVELLVLHEQPMHKTQLATNLFQDHHLSDEQDEDFQKK